jgi:hypothetical protein
MKVEDLKVLNMVEKFLFPSLALILYQLKIKIINENMYGLDSEILVVASTLYMILSKKLISLQLMTKLKLNISNMEDIRI